MKKGLFFSKKSIILFAVILVIIVLLIHNFYPYKISKDYSKLDLDRVNKLMIVAHPDDEILWGGSHLIEDDYLVVCVTCGTVRFRVNEFISVMKKTNDEYIMLGYPDKTKGKRDNWDDWRDKIATDLKEIIELKDWDTIVTHNPDGEYGHEHHKMTSALVTEVTQNKEKLYYFGHYHSKNTIEDYLNEMTPIKDENLKQKKNILKLYLSQYFTVKSFDHMYQYEDWVKYEDWDVEK